MFILRSIQNAQMLSVSRKWYVKLLLSFFKNYYRDNRHTKYKDFCLMHAFWTGTFLQNVHLKYTGGIKRITLTCIL